jgi:hypothetical protein
MSASKEWTDYHLTKSGWVVGSQKIDFAGTKEMPAPLDRVLTCRFHEEMSSPFSPRQTWTDETWRSKDEAAVQALLKKYGECPGGIAGLSQ